MQIAKVHLEREGKKSQRGYYQLKSACFGCNGGSRSGVGSVMFDSIRDGVFVNWGLFLCVVYVTAVVGCPFDF